MKLHVLDTSGNENLGTLMGKINENFAMLKAAVAPDPAPAPVPEPAPEPAPVVPPPSPVTDPTGDGEQN